LVLRPGREHSRVHRLPLQAGWLFADLLLVLFIVSLASLPAGHKHHKPTPPPHSVPPRVLDRTPVQFHLNVPPADFEGGAPAAGAVSALLRQLNQALASRHLQHEQAGFVQVFASGPVTAIGQALTAAKQVISIVEQRSPAFADAVGRGYWSGSGDYLKFVVFFFTTPVSGQHG